MTLVLQGIALDELPMSQPLIGRFDERGGTLGRSDTVNFTLPDPERTISRIQAQVLHRDEGYWIENVSAAIPILHNDRPLSAGMRVLLREGDELRIGGYTLRAAFEGSETSASVLSGRDVSSEDLWRGFLKGAGITTPLSERPSVELLSTIGAMLRIASEGLYRLVAMRALAKDEMQAQMTKVEVRETNPLKFAPDADVALQQMLQPPVRGFLAGPAALRDALIELESHQVGVMAAMHAALEGVLDRFDPSKLATTPDPPSLFEALRPARHKARLWELYLKQFSALRQQAREDFQHCFGTAFRQAYEAQVRGVDSGAAPDRRHHAS